MSIVTADYLGSHANAGEIRERIRRSLRQTEDCGGVEILQGTGVSKPPPAKQIDNPPKLNSPW